MEHTILISGISAVLSAILVYLIKNKGLNTGRYESLLNRYDNEITFLREENRKHTLQIQQLTQNQTKQETIIQLLESAHQFLPIPQWLKDKEGTMLSLNAAYEEIFLLPRGKSREDYEFHKDADVWPFEVAIEFRANDLKVFKSGKPFRGTEIIPNSKGENESWQIIKYVRYAGDIKIGIGGIAFPTEHNLDA